jgi:hypothetical protein
VANNTIYTRQACHTSERHHGRKAIETHTDKVFFEK